MKLRDPHTKQAFQIEIQNRFESLFLQEEKEVRNGKGDGDEQVQDIDITNVQRKKTKRIFVDT